MDFVIPWVDGEDPKWLHEFKKYSHLEGNSKAARYRDWDNLQFLFRGIENFAPWVDQIHFITWGHLPKWMDISHPKLHIVRHQDFIPEKYLPTFNARTIELNVHRINKLADEYVLFNDDSFMIKEVRPDVFFKNGKPCHQAVFDAHTARSRYEYTLFTDLYVIAKHFSKYRGVKQKPFKWFNFKYGSANFKNLLLLLAKKGHTGFTNPHQAQPHLKKTLETLWELEYDIMDNSCRQKFRIYPTVNQGVQRYWDLASNNFHPSRNRGQFFRLDNRHLLEKATACIKGQKKPLICLNDSDLINETEFLWMKNEIKRAFKEILPVKSKFEL